MSVHNSVYNSDDGDDYVEDPVTLISRLDISDPLYLHPNDSTALIVVLIKLKETKNYQVWSCAMLLALEGKNKSGFIDGSCKRSNRNEVLGRQWDRVNVVGLRWILNYVSHELFLGLDDSYMQIRSSILSREVLPDVRSAYATISSEESHRVTSGSIAGSSQRNQPSAFVSNVPNRNNFQKKTRSSFKGKAVSNNNSIGPGSSSGIIDEQMSTLISVIKDNKIGKNIQANMIEENQHMTYLDNEFDNVLDISHLKIKFGHPNGTEAFISKIRNLRLYNGLILYDVLVIPEYCVTLISVHKLARDNKIFVVFVKNRCYFVNHDLNLRNVLGIGFPKGQLGGGPGGL
ncbi:ribonuclease H-like domain-containing protein [Tanacetum coccineum]